MRGARFWSVAASVLSVLSTIAVLALARPASATAQAAPALSRFALTTAGAPVVASGTADAGGGLLLTDQGTATVTGRLDNSPSAHAAAVAAEPGQSLRSLSASNGGPTVPGASAQYPGGPAHSTDSTVGSTEADASMRAAAATAKVDTSGKGATASERLAANALADRLTADVRSQSGTVTVGGVLAIGNVIGTAAVAYDHTGHRATTSITVTSATVAGVPVGIDSTGVHALGSTVPAGSVPDPVATTLAKAGITVSFLQPVRTTSATGALADSGALVIHLQTPDVTSPTATVSSATDFTLYLGRAQATVFDAPAHVATQLPTTTGGLPTTSAPAAADAGTVSGPPLHTGAQPPVVAPATPTTGPVLALLGRHMSTRTAFAAFGTWQLLTLGLVTLAVLTTKSRRELAHLCPCPAPPATA